MMRSTSYLANGLVFDVSEHGPRNGDPVVLLHGWPGGSPTWDGVAPQLGRAGFRVLVPDQRGYSPLARPAGRWFYAIQELTTDVLGLLDAAGCTRAHVVGHDWGGAVAWHLAATAPQRVSSLTVLSTPHPRAMLAALRSSDQALRSAYIAAFQLPLVPERILLARRGALFRRALRNSRLAARTADSYVDRLTEPGALRSSLAWYRALPWSQPTGDIDVSTVFLWGEEDAALGPWAAEHTARHVTGPYRFEAVPGASHWLPEQHAPLVVAAIEAHTRTTGPAG